MANLLILGAGQFGLMVKEIAESTREYKKIDFLDDSNSIAIGKLEEYHRFSSEYEYAVVAIGNSLIRKQYIEKLKEKYKIATVISPLACVFKSSMIGEGTIVEPMATVQTGAIVGKGCIISSGTVIRHNSNVEDYCHLDCNSVVVSNVKVPAYTKVEIGSCFKNTETFK